MSQFRIGLALSGGGAKGFAHAGAITALKEYNLVPDIVSGTSAGSVVGAFLCGGFDMKRVPEVFTKYDRGDFISLTVPRDGFFKIDGFLRFLEKELPVKTFEELNVPLRVVATDFDKGEIKVFKSGNLVPAVGASSSLPIVFKPMYIDGVHYVDGGLFKNFPVSILRDECDFVIGINVSPHLNDEYKNTILYIASKSYQYMFKSNIIEDLQMCDFLVEVDEALQYSVFELAKAQEIYNLGYKTTKECIEKALADHESPLYRFLNLNSTEE